MVYMSKEDVPIGICCQSDSLGPYSSIDAGGEQGCVACFYT